MSRSSFPNKIDQFIELFDLPANKVADALEMQKLKAKSTLDNNEQNRLSALQAELQDYTITPETMNKLQDAIVEIEKFFDGNVRQYILSKQKEWDTYVNDFTCVGNWDSTKKYQKQNLVSYNGNLWLCIKDIVSSAGKTPDKLPDNWRQVSYKGDKGDIGLNATYKGEWSGSIQYKAGDAVSVRSDLPWKPVDMVFIAKKDNEGQKPTVGAASDYWFPYHNLVYGTYDFIDTNTPMHPDVTYIKELREL
ncbi:hypothetical protein DKZ29_07920 [Limosilactobacillus reuteri]|uniref:Chitin-binding type-3 domain-containing protein n=1 Tax=Limosilactobacillus reuteri TaxID=1598 RepID=A0ABD6Y6T3_LIMRT|nr:carbohydrate-binding protein [Limosilactobacillus reuteri]PWT34585.1 hypothetical protein DKZ24_08155 [Limosilactobacillus reuteri]PWT37477.1 hypothetical protein DKZ35_05070 [Limosilactobacillus reuteri]PWT57655.1 hypothetical protein DKZ29_07920 [Limosilactobacillus reuteri]PWT58453.1 hypothetical protein DKZ30_08065 [Limosilactobacillus reuteri]PWT65341.1 hypothetical protein DKZ28_08165 [Limosilactobacillus reuteri]